jgi:hypothetical protein
VTESQGGGNNNRNRSENRNRSNSEQDSTSNESGGGSRNHGDRPRRRKHGKKNKQKSNQAKNQTNNPKAKAQPEKSAKKAIKIKPFHHVYKKYGLVIFNTFEAAYQNLEKIKNKTQDVDQLNIVIHAEGNIDNPKLNKIDKVKVFAGTAWTLIHDRRVEDGWYDEPR